MKRFLTILVVAILAIGSVSAQKKNVAALTTEVEALKQQNGTLSTEVEALKQQNAELQQQINDAKAREKKLQEENNVIRGEVKALVAQVEVLSVQLTALAGEVAKILEMQAVTPAVALAPAKPSYEVVGKVHNGMAKVKEGPLYGYVNSKNEYVIKAQFEEAEDFKGGYAIVRKNDKFGVVDTTGKIIVPCLYDNVVYYGDLFKVTKGGKVGIISRSGKIVLECVYSSVSEWAWKNNSIFVVCKNGKCGIIDAAGKICVPFLYDELQHLSNQSNDCSIWVAKKEQCWGIVSANGAVIAPFKYQYISTSIYGGRILMEINGKKGYFDANGKVVIPARYDWADYFDVEGKGLAMVSNDDEDYYYYIDRNGNFVKKGESKYTTKTLTVTVL